MKKSEVITRLVLTLVILVISLIWYKSGDISQLNANQAAGFRICITLFTFLGICAAWGDGDGDGCGYFDGHHNP